MISNNIEVKISLVKNQDNRPPPLRRAICLTWNVTCDLFAVGQMLTIISPEMTELILRAEVRIDFLRDTQ